MPCLFLFTEICDHFLRGGCSKSMLAQHSVGKCDLLLDNLKVFFIKSAT